MSSAVTLLLLGSTCAGGYLLAASTPPATVVPQIARAVLPAMRLEEHAAAEAEQLQALEERMNAEAAVARSPETLAQFREAGAKRAAALVADTAVAAALEKGGAKPAGKMAKLLKRPKGTIALIGECVSVEVASMGGFDLDDPAYLSGEFRVGGCTAVSVPVAERAVLKEGALATVVEEQESVRGDFPGPLPALVRDDFVEAAQLAAAAADGAKMVLLSLALVGADGIGDLLTEAERLGLEAVVRVADEAELEAALSSGAKMVCIGDVNLSQAAELVARVPAEVISVADFYTDDVRGMWKVRDMGFNAAIVGVGLLEVCVRDRVPPAAVLKAMNSKGSVKYGLGMQKGRLEGSKENLGTIAM